MANISIRYQIAQKVRSWRLKRKHTLKDLAGKANINYHTLLRYEQGTCGIPIEKLKILAGALSIPVGNLFPRRKVLKEDSCFDKAKTQEMYNFIEKTGGHKAIYMLTKSVRAEEESNIKAARIRIAKNLVKAGFATEIIYRATGLSTDEYDNKKEKGYEHSNEGQEIKKWRIIRGYTQEELAKKLNVGPSQIHHYEQGSVTLLSERLWEIAKELSVDTEDLIKEYKENDCEDGEAENELLGLAREYRKIDNQESRDELNIWVEFLLQRKQIYKEKIDKVEKIKVTNNLLKFATGEDLDSLAEFYGVERQNEEDDEHFRKRIKAKIAGWSTGGSKEYYKYHALSADSRVKDALVESPIPGKVQISILSTKLSTLPEELLEIVRKQVTRDDIRVLTDTITVAGCNIMEIDIHSRMSISPVISKEEIKKQFIKKFELAKRLGWSVTRSWIIANLFVEGVENVELIEPKEDVVVLGNECANLRNLKIELN